MPTAIVVPIAGMVFVLAIVLGVPLVRAYTRRTEHDGTLLQSGATPETSQRLERIENAIDAMSIEVERISESQRFVTKLLAERAQSSVGSSSAGGNAS